MIRFCDKNDFEALNNLLKNLNYALDSESFNNEFLKVIGFFDNALLGCLVYTYIYDRIEIEYIIVDDKYKRQGIATKLLNFIEKNNDIKNITLEVRKSNEEAINFYKKNGFEIVTTRKNYYNNEDAYLMIKKFGD